MITRARVLKIGIAPREVIQSRTLAIARGELKPHPDDPKVWFTSLESLAQVLSTKNKLLLEMIFQSKPTSMAELSRLSGRTAGNLSRTLHTMERYGLVNIRHEGVKRIPEVICDKIELDMSLTRDACVAEFGLGRSRLELVH